MLMTIERRSASDIIDILRSMPRKDSLPEELILVDRICQRWAVSVGSGLPSDDWDDTRKARLSELDPETAIVVDQIIEKLPIKYHTLCVRWYKSPTPRSVIAKLIGLPRSTVYVEWRCLLWYLRGLFQSAGIDC